MPFDISKIMGLPADLVNVSAKRVNEDLGMVGQKMTEIGLPSLPGVGAESMGLPKLPGMMALPGLPPLPGMAGMETKKTVEEKHYTEGYETRKEAQQGVKVVKRSSYLED